MENSNLFERLIDNFLNLLPKKMALAYSLIMYSAIGSFFSILVLIFINILGLIFADNCGDIAFCWSYAKVVGIIGLVMLVIALIGGWINR